MFQEGLKVTLEFISLQKTASLMRKAWNFPCTIWSTVQPSSLPGYATEGAHNNLVNLKGGTVFEFSGMTQAAHLCHRKAIH